MAEVRGMIIEISGVYYSKKGTRELSRKIDTMLRWPAKESFTIQGDNNSLRANCVKQSYRQL